MNELVNALEVVGGLVENLESLELIKTVVMCSLGLNVLLLLTLIGVATKNNDIEKQLSKIEEMIGGRQDGYERNDE